MQTWDSRRNAFKTRQNEKICRICGSFGVADAAVLCATVSRSSRQKAEEERKKADEKANDEAYKALMKRTPNGNNKKIDPWGGLRTGPGK